MEILIGIGILFGLMYVMGCAFQKDLKDMEKTHPKFRKHLKDNHDL
jgi:predicted small metal-binding protein